MKRDGSASGPVDRELADRIVMHTRSAAGVTPEQPRAEQAPSGPSADVRPPRARPREVRIGALAIVAGAAGILLLAAALRKLFGGRRRS